MIKFNAKIASAAIAAVLAASSAFAQTSVALPFMRIDRDPASAGMGFAGAASSSNIAYSSFRNSSIIPFSSQKGAADVSFQGWAPDGSKSTNINFGAAFKAGQKLGFSIGGAYDMGDEYDIWDDSGISKGTFKPSEMMVNAGIGYRIIDNLSAGVNVRYATEKLAEGSSYSAVAADAFLTYRISGLNVSAGVSSIGGSVKDASGNSFKIPSSATVAVDWSKTFGEVHGIEAALDADYYLSGCFTLAAGAQYSFKDMIFLRAGYHYGAEDAVLPSFATVGLGAKFVGINIDFAYLTGNEFIGNTLTVGLGYSF